MSGGGLLALAHQQREAAARASLGITRALASAVDAELQRSVAVLETLASSVPRQEVGMAAFDLQARDVRQTQPGWLAVILSDAAGRAIVNTSVPFGSEPPPLAESASFQTLLRTRQPVIGSVATGRGGQYGVPTRVPVVRDGELRYVLTGVVQPKAILDVVLRQRTPDGWVVTVLDANGLCVARSRRQEQFLGQPASASLQTLIRREGHEGTGITETLEGDSVYTGFTRLPGSGWVVAIGIPATTVESAGRRSLMAYGGGLLLSLLLGGAGVLLVARSINRPIGGLARAAQAMGRGEAHITPPASDIREIQDLGAVLALSAQQRAQAQAQRDELLQSERDARDAAERAGHRLERIAAASAKLSHTLEQSAVLEAIASIIVPGVADWCRVDLLDAKGVLQRALTHHSDPDKARLGAELVHKLRAAPGQVGSMSWAVETGRSHLARFDPAAEFDAVRDADLLSFARAIGLRAYFIVPLVARGRTLGALAALQAESSREFSDEDCALVSELAHRAALALDNARLYAETQTALKEAQHAHRAKDEFLAMLGHELRNPLAPIVTALHLMRLRDGEGGSAHERRIIERQVAHLSRLVDDLLDVSRITQGKVQLQLALVDVKQVVSQSLELTQPALQSRARPVQLQITSRDAFVWGDAVRLTQVLCNLLINAAKFTPPDRDIRLQLSVAHDMVRIAVEDEGSGIGPELLPRVFDLFVQGEQPLARHVGGLGLGLAIVRTLVQMHGGRVQAHSEGPGEGSRFVVWLPLVEAGTQRRAEPPPAATHAAGGHKVLVVDDNRDAAESLALLLAAFGYEVRTAASADAALALLDGFHPHIALLDIGLPGMDGYQLARRLRHDPRSARTRRVALTGYGADADRARALAECFDAHLVKPVQMDRLLAVLDELLQAQVLQRDD